MRFLTVTHFFESHGGGIERVAGQLCRELARAGHGSAWIASAADTPPDDPLIAALPISCIDPTEALSGLPMPIPGPGGILALARAVKAADIVVVHDALYITSIAARLLAWRHRKPVVLIQHIAEIPFASVLLRWIIRLANALVTRPMLRRAQQVVFISDTVRSAFADVAYPRPPALLFNGVDPEIFAPGPGDRTRFDLIGGGRVAAFAGRFVEKKGLSVIEALARARPDVTFALAGSGPIDPRHWNLANVRCLGALKQTELAALYRTADFLLLPSVGEGFPLVIQEAMACGLPVFCGEESAGADPGASKFLRGLPVDLSDSAATATGFAAELDNLPDPKERAAMARYAANAYSWKGMAQRIAELAASL